MEGVKVALADFDTEDVEDAEADTRGDGEADGAFDVDTVTELDRLGDSREEAEGDMDGDTLTELDDENDAVTQALGVDDTSLDAVRDIDEEAEMDTV